MNHLSNQKRPRNSGFITMLGLFSIMIMASLAIIFSFLHHSTEAKGEFRKVCFIEIPKLQSEMEMGTNTILALNPLAIYYRTTIKLVLAKFLLAVAMKNPAAPTLAMELNKLRAEQKQLGLKQQQLIRGFEFTLQTRLAKLNIHGQSHLYRNNSKWQEFVIARDVLTMSPMNYQLPIEPDEPSSPAPVYRMKPNLGFATRITANWKSFVFANSKNQKLQDQNTQWGFECTVEQRMTKEYGPPLIKVDLKAVVKADKL